MSVEYFEYSTKPCESIQPRSPNRSVGLIHTQDGLSARFRRNGILRSKPYHNTCNLQLLEQAISLLSTEQLPALDRVVAISILDLLIDITRVEKLSTIWLQHRDERCLELIQLCEVNLKIWDQDELDCWAWAAIDLIGAAVPPRSLTLQIRSNDNDVKMRLAQLIFGIFGSSGGGLGLPWAEMEQKLKDFFWMDSCVVSWECCWRMVDDAKT